MNILIVGAAGNLGSHMARHLLNGPHRLRLLVHRTSLPQDLANHPNITVTSGDLDDPASLHAATVGVNCIVYVAGVLFEPRPERFLRRTNTIYAQNIVDAALRADVDRFILISFPHIEENTAPDSPAMGRLDVQPKSIHARTRLEAEKYLFSACQNKSTIPIVLRAGVIYGRAVKLIEAARKLMRYRLLAIWPSPTWIHLLALPDFWTSVEIAIERGGLSGIYNLCDDYPVLLQEFLDELAEHWGYRKPWRLPNGCFYLAATVCEWLATILHSGTPLKSPEDFKNKKTAISRFGSSSGVNLRLSLEKLGVKPELTQIIQVGGVSTRQTALLAGQVDATILSDPQATTAIKNGMKLWVDLSDKKWGFPRYCHNCFMAKRSYLDGNREQAVNVLKAVIEGLYSMKLDKPMAVRWIKKYLRLDDESASIGYDFNIAKHGAGVLSLPERQGLEFVIAEVAKINPKAAGATLESLKLLEPSLLDEIRRSGFLDRMK